MVTDVKITEKVEITETQQSDIETPITPNVVRTEIERLKEKGMLKKKKKGGCNVSSDD